MGSSCFTLRVPPSNLHSPECCLDEKACSFRNTDNIFMLEYNKTLLNTHTQTHTKYSTNALCVFANTNNSFPVTHTHTHKTLADIKRVCGGVLLSGIQCQMRDFNKVNCHYFNALWILGANSEFKVLQEKIMTDAKRLIWAQGRTFVHADRERAVHSDKGIWSHFCIVFMNLLNTVDCLAWNIHYTQ